MYSSEIKKDCRRIYVGKGKEMLNILLSVQGQLSDGMWENSPRMEGYWLFFTVEKDENDNVYLLISNHWGEIRWGGKEKYNAFKRMDDCQIKEWFANKIKQIIKQEQKDNWSNHSIEWKRDCNEPSIYMHDDLTVRECYRAYDQLLNRPQKY